MALLEKHGVRYDPDFVFGQCRAYGTRPFYDPVPTAYAGWPGYSALRAGVVRLKQALR